MLTSPGKKQMCFRSMCFPNVIWSRVSLMCRVSTMSHSRARGWLRRADSRRGIWLWKLFGQIFFSINRNLIDKPWLFEIGPASGFAVFGRWSSVLQHRVHWVVYWLFGQWRPLCSSCTWGSWRWPPRGAPPGRWLGRWCWRRSQPHCCLFSPDSWCLPHNLPSWRRMFLCVASSSLCSLSLTLSNKSPRFTFNKGLEMNNSINAIIYDRPQVLETWSSILFKNWSHSRQLCHRH